MTGKLQALLKWLLLLPVFAVVVLLALANDQVVRVSFNPFDTSDPLALQLPFYQFGFAIFVAGVLCGGFVVWNSQRKYRRKARQRDQDAKLWRNRAEKAEKPPVDPGRLIASQDNPGI